MEVFGLNNTQEGVGYRVPVIEPTESSKNCVLSKYVNYLHDVIISDIGYQKKKKTVIFHNSYS